MKKEVIRIAYKYIILLLIAALLCTGTVFSRYASQNSYTSGVSVGAFRYSYTVDEVSAGEFSNVNYYYEDDTNNTTGYTKSVGAGSNYITFTIDGSASDVDAQSTFTFSSDYEFLYDLAFQVTELTTDGTSGTTETAITPQYVVSKILSGNNNAATHGQYYSVNNSGYLDYGEVSGYNAEYNNLTITASNSTSFTATSVNGNNKTAVFTLATSSSSHNVTYIFGRGLLRDASGGIVTSGGTNDRSGTEVYVTSTVMANTSSLAISLPELCITAGETRTFRFYFTKVNATDYTSNLYCKYYDTSDTVVSGAGVQQRYYNVQYVPCCNESGSANGNTATIKVVNDYTGTTPATSYYYVNSSNEEILLEETSSGSNIYGDTSSGIYINLSSVILSALQNYYYNSNDWSVTEYAVGAEYGMTFDVTFEQASELPQ